MDFTVQHKKESGKGPNRRLRSEGLNSGVIYGKGEPVMISMRSDYAYRMIQSFHGTVKTLNLIIEDGDQKNNKMVIVQDYQVSNWGQRLIHVDFREVDENTIVDVDVPVVPTDDCQAIKLGGILQIVRSSVPIRAAVKNVPNELVANVKELNVGESVHVLDLNYPEGVEAMNHGRNFTILTIAGASSEEAEEGEETTEEEATA